MDSFKKYVQNTFGDWMLDPKHLYVGREFELNMPNGSPITARIMKIDSTHVWLAQIYGDGKENVNFSVKVPIASLPHLTDDLNGKVITRHKSGNKYIDAILDNKGEYVGKGEEGVTYRVMDKIVKIASTVPIHPIWYNRPHRTPEEAITKLQHEYEISEYLLSKGVSGILAGDFVIHEGRAYYVRPFVEVMDRKPLNFEQLMQLKQSIEEMHNAGVAIRDYIQIGLLNNQVYHYDLGFAQKTNDKNDFKDDISNLFSKFNESGYDLYNPPTYAHRPLKDRFKKKS